MDKELFDVTVADAQFLGTMLIVLLCCAFGSGVVIGKWLVKRTPSTRPLILTEDNHFYIARDSGV
jgi:hypothetical protein